MTSANPTLPVDPELPSTEIRAQMALELAANIQPAAAILSRYDVDPAYFKDHIAKDPQFVAMFKEAKTFWNSDANAKERITVKAQAMLEDSLLELHQLFHDPAKNPTARMDALKSMMKLAKMDAGESREAQGIGAGRAVHVNINLGSAGKIERHVTLDHEEQD